MGQGLYTKLIQVAGAVLGIPVTKIHTTRLETNTMPNASVAGASVQTDLYGPAVVEACQEVNRNLAKYKEQLGGPHTYAPRKIFRKFIYHFK